MLISVGSTALAHANRHVDSHICAYLTVGGTHLPASNIFSNQDRIFGRESQHLLDGSRRTDDRSCAHRTSSHSR
jgi:hypothetical protein